MYVYCGSGGVVGVEPTEGKQLWETTDWKISIATVPSPVPLPDGRVFLSGGYNAGSLMLRLSQTEETWGAETLFRLEADIFGATQQTPVFLDGNLYGIRPDGQFVCLDLEGNLVWTSGAEVDYGLGPFLPAGGLFFAMDDSGKITLFEASTTGYRELAQTEALQGREAWAPLTLAGGRLLAREMTNMVCLEVGAAARN
jgi:outer membrane protein assembly factor BamB